MTSPAKIRRYALVRLPPSTDDSAVRPLTLVELPGPQTGRRPACGDDDSGGGGDRRLMAGT